MKKIVPLFLIIMISLAGCKKLVDKIKQDLVVDAMTDGQWKVTVFTLNGTNITTDFATYRFKYYKNKTVDAIKSGVVEKTGSWDGNASTMTTWANFNSAVYPLDLINGNWHIDNNSWTFVEASQTSGGNAKVMRLDKE